MPVSPDRCPALVLNADFRPLSYFPLSLWSWQDAVKAVFLDRVNIISEYDTVVRSPTFEMRLPSVISLKEYIATARRPAFTRFNVFLRDRFVCQYCGEPRPSHDLGQCRDGVLELQSPQGQPPAAGERHASRDAAGATHDAAVAGERPGVPAQLSPPQLARLPLLGHRTRSRVSGRAQSDHRITDAVS